MKVVFDMDTGVDDSLALIYALNRPAYEIQGIGCVYGNVESWLARLVGSADFCNLIEALSLASQ